MARLHRTEIAEPNPVHAALEGLHDFIAGNKVAILAGLVVTVLIVGGAVIYQRERHQKDEEAWYKLKKADDMGKLAEVRQKYSDTSAKVWILLRLGDKKYEEKFYREAAVVYEEALDVPGKDIMITKMLYLNLAYANEEMKQYEKAVAYLKKLIELPGDDFWKKEAVEELEILKEIKEEEG